MNEMLQRKNSQRRKQQQSGNVLLVVGTILFTTLVIFLLPTPATSFTLIARPALSQHATLFHQQSPLFQLSAAASIAEANDGNVYDNNSQQESSATTTSTNLSLFQNAANPPQLSPIQSALTRIGLMLFIASMCIALPLTLLPQLLLRKMNVISRLQGEQFALRTGQKCARNLMKLIPFCRIEVESDLNLSLDYEPEPCIWVCNHTSMLDVFVMLAADKRLRGPNKRPIKIVYVSTYHRLDSILYGFLNHFLIIHLFDAPVETIGRQSSHQTPLSSLWLHSSGHEGQRPWPSQ